MFRIMVGEIMLYLTLNYFSNQKAKIVGFGDDATFEEVVE